jgi:transposase InsO family protein/transposase-like protein
MIKTNIKSANHKWVFTDVITSLDYLPKIKLLDKYERWRKVAQILKISKVAKLRLEWIIYYHEGHNATETGRHFGISRKTFYKWFAKFQEDNLYSLYEMEDQSKAPKTVRQCEVTPKEEQRIIFTKKKHICIGKDKLPTYYKRYFNEEISSWKCQAIIKKHKLYYHPKKNAKMVKRRKMNQKKKRITELQNLKWWEKKSGYIICLDTVVIYLHNCKRYIFTAIDKYGKVAYARMYKNKSTFNAKDFLLRLHYLLDGNVPRVGHDNGSEFEKLFKYACRELKIEQYYSRIHTPKDNAVNERFNRTLKEEFISLGNFHSDPDIFNRKMTEWLIEYNFYRPHKSLSYKTPIEYSKLSPMYSSRTRI